MKLLYIVLLSAGMMHASESKESKDQLALSMQLPASLERESAAYDSSLSSSYRSETSTSSEEHSPILPTKVVARLRSKTFGGKISEKHSDSDEDKKEEAIIEAERQFASTFGELLKTHAKVNPLLAGKKTSAGTPGHSRKLTPTTLNSLALRRHRTERMKSMNRDREMKEQEINQDQSLTKLQKVIEIGRLTKVGHVPIAAAQQGRDRSATTV